MADGTSYPLLNLDAVDALRLADSVGPERHLVAHCASCDRAAPCDPTPWFKEGLATLPLRSFQTRLRCVCGCRQARLEVQAGAYTRPNRSDLYIFR